MYIWMRKILAMNIRIKKKKGLQFNEYVNIRIQFKRKNHYRINTLNNKIYERWGFEKKFVSWMKNYLIDEITSVIYKQ